MFKKEFHMTPIEYRNFLRLNKAKQYLEYGEISIQEIANLLGYSTVSHFIKSFKEYYGISPLAYRNQFVDNLSYMTSKKENFYSLETRQEL